MSKPEASQSGTVREATFHCAVCGMDVKDPEHRAEVCKSIMRAEWERPHNPPRRWLRLLKGGRDA